MKNNTTNDREFRRGELYYIKRDEYSHDGKPAVIVSGDEMNSKGANVVVAFLTLNYVSPELEGTSFKLTSTSSFGSTVIASSLVTVKKFLVGDYIDILSENDEKRLDNALKKALGLDTAPTVNVTAETTRSSKVPSLLRPNITPTPHTPDSGNEEEMKQLTFERDWYKQKYDDLFERVMNMAKQS